MPSPKPGSLRPVPLTVDPATMLSVEKFRRWMPSSPMFRTSSPVMTAPLVWSVITPFWPSWTVKPSKRQ